MTINEGALDFEFNRGYEMGYKQARTELIEDEIKFLKGLIENTTIKESTWVLLMVKPRLDEKVKQLQSLNNSQDLNLKARETDSMIPSKDFPDNKLKLCGDKNE